MRCLNYLTLFLIAIFLNCPNSSNAQSGPIAKMGSFYGAQGIALVLNDEALGVNGGLSGNFVFPSLWGISIAYKHFNYDPQFAPYGNTAGFFGTRAAPDRLGTLNIALMREFRPKSSPYIRLGIEAGPSYANYLQYHYTEIPSSGGWFSLGPTYRQKPVTQEALGLYLRGRISFPFSQAIGVEFAVVGNVNKLRGAAAFELYL